MKKKQIDYNFENKDIINHKTKPKIRKTSIIPPVLNPNRNMYSSPSLETNITSFNVITPGIGTGDAIMATHNPSLLAISKKASSTIRPKVKPSINFPPVTQGITSLLSKKPLSDLPEPTKNYYEKNQEKSEMEKKSLSFNEDPIAYFSKRKDGRGHLFIYMVYKKDRKDPEFSPYELIKVPFSDIGNDYFTMSASGVTHIDEFGNTENITLDRWAKEESAYLSIKKLKVFRLYFYWKSFRVWRNFVQKMHFQEKLTFLVKNAFFYHAPISKSLISISYLISTSDWIITKYLFPFEQSKKFTVFDFNQYSEWNFEELQKQYKKIIDQSTEILNKLYSSIDDPNLLQVDDSEFKEIKRKNPDITHLKILEQKKENERISRLQKMETEINAISNFIRMLDYLFLESLRRSCYESFKNADSIVSSDLSAIFTIEVSFSDDADISFTPTKEGMLEIVNSMMNKALMQLDSLPRIIQVPELRDILINCGIRISDLYTNGPNLIDILDTAPDIKEAINHINEVISIAYDESYKYLQSLVYFYPLYKLGKTWDVRNYLRKRNGQKFSGDAHFSDDIELNNDFLINSQEQPIIDFDETEKVIEYLRSEAQKVDEIRLGTVKGPLYADSKKLKAELTPIPSRSIKSLESTFSELISTRITLLNTVFQSYISKLNQDPNSLDLYVEFSHVAQETSELLPQITNEIQFIDKSVNFFDKVRFSLIKNPLHPIFERFKADQKKALQLCEKLNDKFTFVLTELIKKKETQIQELKISSQEIPISIQNIDLENFFKQTIKLKSKCEQFEEPIKKMLFQQKVLNMNIADFKEFSELKQNIAFSEKVYQAVKYWQNLNNQIISIPFAHVSMNEFTESVNCIQSILDELKEMKEEPSPILDELTNSFSTISPFVNQLTQLNNGRLHTRHWENLFDLCGHKGEYSISMTIQMMIDNGILSNENIIDEITKTSIGESQLDIEFQAILAHWADVTIPFIDQQTKDEDQLLLGDLSSLLNEIKATSDKLNKMLSNRFVKGIKKQVQKLINSMSLYMNILDKWQIFQGNWTTISTLFNQKVVKNQLPHQTTRFEIVRKKWQNIVQHAKSDNKIISVCSYQNMLEDFIESNKSLEIILESIPTYLDSKRKLIPRLYFLSNLEVLTLLSTKDFAIFTKQITKAMMNIQRIEFNLSDDKIPPMTESARESCNFIGLNISGVVGEDGDSLSFVNAIQCPGPIEQWIPQLFEMMEASTKDALSLSLSRFASSSLTDWAMTVSSSIAMLTLQISYTRDVEDCFNSLEANPNSFISFEQKLKTQIHDFISLMSTSLSSLELYKISYFLGIILNQYESSRSFQEKIQSYSHIEAWHDMIKFKYNASNAEVNIVIGDKCWVRGHEHWGRVPRLIFTTSIQNALTNILISKENNQAPLIFGSSMNGKSSLLELYSFIMGRFCYIMPSFPNLQHYFIEQIITGASLTGCSLIFKNIDQFSMTNQAEIFDFTREIMDNITHDKQKFKFFDVDDDIDINPDLSIMFTATEKYSTMMTHQLRDFVRPIGLSIADIRKLAESSLISSGFKTAKILSSKLDDLTKTILTLFNMNLNRFKHIIGIVIEGHRILLQMIHKIKIDGFDYSKEPKKAESYAISRASFDHFKILIDPEKQDLLLILIHSAFHLTDDIEQFSDLMMSPYNFYIDKANEILLENVKNTIKELNYEVPSDYLLLQAQSLMEMMFSYPCIIICGPENSGKSLLVNLLSNAFADMINDPDLIDQYGGLMPFKVEPIYHQSNSYENIFGTIIHDDLVGYKWLNGLFQSSITNLEKYSKTNHRILRFDGVLTPELEKFLCQFISNQEKFRLNNLGSFIDDKCFHCIIETNDISNISPQLLNLSAVLMMNSVQYSRNHLLNEIDLLQPSIPFSFVRKEFDNKFKEEEYSIIFQTFSKVAPVFVKNFKIDLSIVCIRYCLNYLLDNKINCIKEELVLLVMSISFYTCYCSYSTDSHTIFSNWVVEQFSLKIPLNWDDLIDDDDDKNSNQNYIELDTIHENEQVEKINESSKKISKERSFLYRSNRSISTSLSNLSGETSMSAIDEKLPVVFIDYFEKPTLENIKVENDKITIIDTSYLRERIIVKGCQFADDIIVPNVQHLSSYSTFKISMKPHSHIFLNGPSNSGKYALLKTVFSKNESICPVFFNVSSSKGCTIQMIINKIKEETTLMQKMVCNATNKKIYALIFNDLSPENINVTEFIRALINENKIVLTSKIDSKYYDVINVDPDDFFVVIRSESNQFNTRFLKHFLMIHTEEYTHDTKMYIANKAMGALGISIEMIQLLIFIFEKMNYSLSEMINSFIIFANINVNSVDTIRVLMTSIYFNRFNIDNEEQFDSFLDEIKNESSKFPTFQDAINQFREEKIFARAIQNVTSEVLTIDKNRIKEFMSKELKSAVYDESVYNFIQIDHSLGIMGHNCVVYSSTSSSPMTLLTLVCKFQKYVLFEIVDIQSIKDFITQLIDDDGLHVHVLIVRKSSYSLLNSILKIFTMFIFYSIYTEEEIIQIAAKVFNININKKEAENKESENSKAETKEKTENQNKVDHNTKQKLFEKIKKLIRYNCRIAVLPNYSFENKVNDLLTDFDIIQLIEPSKHSICSDMIKQNAKNLEIVLIEISEAIEPYLPYSNITQFYDFVSFFVQHMSGDMKNAKSRNEEVKNALDFLHKLSLEKSVYDEKLNQIQPNLEKIQEEVELSTSSFQSKNDVISMRKLKLGEEKIFLQTNLENKIEEMKQAQSDMEQLVPNVEIALQRVKELKQTDIDPIRITESDPCDSLKLMLEAIAVLIGVPNTSYETFGHSLLMDEQFVQKIVNGVQYDLITSSSYEQLISYLNNDKLSKKELESVAPVLVILRNLLEAVCAYTARNNIYRDKKIQVDMTKQTLTDFIIDMERELNSIHEIEMQLNQEQKNLMQLQVQNKEFQNQYEKIEKQKKKIDSILQNDSKLKEFWSVEVDQIPGNGDTMIGDSILMAVYIAYAGMLDIDQRINLLEIAQSKLIESSLITSFSSPVSARTINNNSKSIYENENDDSIDATRNNDLWFAVTSKIISKGITIQKSTFLPRSALVDIKHIEILQRIPLIIDPDQIFIELFQNERMLIISLLSSTFINAVIESIQKGQLLVITDVNEFDPKIAEIVSYTKQKEGSQITIGQKTVTKHSNFRAVLVSSLSDVELIPSDLQNKVSVVNVGSSSMETIHTEIVNLFVNYFQPALMNRIIDLQKSELAHQVQIKQFESETLKYFSQISNKIRNCNESDYNYLDDDDMIEQLLKNKSLFLEATGMEESANDIKRELQKVTKPFQSMISIIETFWICAARYLPKIKSYYHFSFKQMISVVKEVFVESKLNEDNEMNEEKVEKFKQKMISSLLKWLYPMISYNDSLFFLFLATFMLNDGNWDDLSSIIQNLSIKINSKLTNEAIIDSTEFNYLIEKLKSCNICDFLSLTKGLISSFFGEKFENEFPIFEIEKSVPPSYQSPSFIISNPNSKDNGPLFEILQYVKLNNKIDNFECLSLSDDDFNLEQIKKKIQSSLKKGNWILLNYSNPSKKAASIINDILYLTTNISIHSDFKLFVNCYTTEFISTHLLSKSKIATMNDFPSIRKNIIQVYQNHSSIINTSSKTIKRLFYIGALIYSILKSRTLLQPFGFNSFNGLDESSFNLFINYSIKFAEQFDSLSSSISQSQSQNIISILSSRNNDPKKLSARSKFIVEVKKDPLLEIPIRNLREFTQNVCFGSSIIEKQDRRRTRAIITHFLSTSIFSENLNYIDQRFPNASLFTIPADGCLSFFVQQISANIPIFGFAEALMENVETAIPFLNWNLSKWAAEPFLSILNNQQKIEDEELNYDFDKLYSIDEINKIEEKPFSPLLQFWMNEIAAFNIDVKKGIKKLMNEIKWKNIFNNNTANNEDSIKRFHSFMKERRDFLINAYNKIAINEVNLKFLNDMKGFFSAYKSYYCVINSVSSDKISIEFDFNNRKSFFVKIVDLSLFNATIENSYLSPIEKEQNEMKFFSQIPPIYMTFGEKTERNKIFLCPLFRNIFPQEKIFIEEETDNFIIDIELNTSKGDKFWLLNSTALFVFVPQIFLSCD